MTNKGDIVSVMEFCEKQGIEQLDIMSQFMLTCAGSLADDDLAVLI